MKLCKFILLFCLFQSITLCYSQPYLTEKSTSFLSKSTIDSIFEKTILKIATEKGVKEQDLVSNYNFVLKEVEEKSNESILEHIQIVDRAIKTLPEENTIKYFNFFQ